jgi:hypothetical protein
VERDDRHVASERGAGGCGYVYHDTRAASSGRLHLPASVHEVNIHTERNSISKLQNVAESTAGVSCWEFPQHKLWRSNGVQL